MSARALPVLVTSTTSSLVLYQPAMLCLRLEEQQDIGCSPARQPAGSSGAEKAASSRAWLVGVAGAVKPTSCLNLTSTQDGADQLQNSEAQPFVDRRWARRCSDTGGASTPSRLLPAVCRNRSVVTQTKPQQQQHLHLHARVSSCISISGLSPGSQLPESLDDSPSPVTSHPASTVSCRPVVVPVRARHVASASAVRKPSSPTPAAAATE